MEKCFAGCRVCRGEYSNRTCGALSLVHSNSLPLRRAQYALEGLLNTSCGSFYVIHTGAKELVPLLSLLCR